MRYPGGKGKSYQHLINLMPPHEVYIETHVGGGAVLRHKRPAAINIALDIDERALCQLQLAQPAVQLLNVRAEEFLAKYQFTGRELVYCDPPYVPETRRRRRVYRHDYTPEDHLALLNVLSALPCMTLVSGYGNDMYDRLLNGWNKHTFQAKTHVDVREETVWFNFDPPEQLHDSRYLGSTFRDREAAKRRLERLQRKVHGMEPRERAAFATWLHQSYPISLSHG